MTIIDYASETANAAANTPATWVRYGRLLRPPRVPLIAASLSSSNTEVSFVGWEPQASDFAVRRVR